MEPAVFPETSVNLSRQHAVTSEKKIILHGLMTRNVKTMMKKTALGLSDLIGQC
jgi:hypothetical protein